MSVAPYQPSFEVTPKVIERLAEIMRLLGRYEGLIAPKPQPTLRRHNQIRTVLGSLAIEGNTLTEEQVTAIFENKRVLGPKREILEVQNAIRTYAEVDTFDPRKVNDLRRAHRSLMKDLIPDAGQFRKRGVGIFAGSRVAHVPPRPARVPGLVQDLVTVLRKYATSPIIMSAVVHCELEFIHPFSDGNGRIGRLWQHAMLSRFHPLFGFLPIESIVHSRQGEYYRVLGACDKAGSSTSFVEFSLTTIEEALGEFLTELRPEPATAITRLDVAREKFGRNAFSRKDYLSEFKTLSTATASRDLREGVEQGKLTRTGDRVLARYRFR